MSERGIHAKTKSTNLQTFQDLALVCSNYHESSDADPSDFLPTSDQLAKEFQERSPDEMLVSKEIAQAISKALIDSLVKSIRFFSIERPDSKLLLIDFLRRAKSVFWNYAFLLKKSTVLMKAEKNLVTHIETLVLWMLEQPSCEEFIEVIYCFLNVVFALVQGRKKKIEVKEHELIGQTLDVCGRFLMAVFICEKSSQAGICSAYHISGCEKKVSLFAENPADGVLTDLVHYLLVGIETISKLDPAGLSEFVRNSLSCVLVHILDIKDFALTINSEASRLAVEKYLLAINIVKNMCNTNAKFEVLRTFFKSNSEKVKNIFFYTLILYAKFHFLARVKNFEEDDSIIGRLYRNLYEIISMIAINSELEGFPVLLFSVILQKV
jgi:hypothetical protein